MGGNIDQNITKNLCVQYNQNLIDHTKQACTDSLNDSSWFDW